LISILLPNLNNRKFLEERIDSIYSQTTSNWELIIVDNYSDDGAWEFFEKLASQDERVKISQAKREGMYDNWNNCIRQATGQYVYIATSDDIMAKDCLEKLSQALDEHPECGLAHCELMLFNEHGEEIPKDWWRRDLFAKSSGDFIHRKHIRKAPFDGLLHLAGRTVYTSITQLLIRKNLFAKTGLFPTGYGSKGDYHWDMKAALLTDTIHVPDTWGGWRQHSNQATEPSGMDSPEHWKVIEAMSKEALNETRQFLGVKVLKFVESQTAMLYIRLSLIRSELALRSNHLRFKYILSEARRYPYPVVALFLDKLKAMINLKREDIPTGWIRFLKDHGLEPQLIPVDKEGHSPCV